MDNNHNGFFWLKTKLFFTLYGFGWIDESTGNETLLAVTADYPIPIRILPIENRYKFATLYAHIIFVSSYKCVQYNVPTRRILYYSIRTIISIVTLLDKLLCLKYIFEKRGKTLKKG